MRRLLLAVTAAVINTAAAAFPGATASTDYEFKLLTEDGVQVGYAVGRLGAQEALFQRVSTYRFQAGEHEHEDWAGVKLRGRVSPAFQPDWVTYEVWVEEGKALTKGDASVKGSFRRLVDAPAASCVNLDVSAVGSYLLRMCPKAP